MTGPALFFQFGLMVVYSLVTLALLALAIIKRRALKVSIPVGLAFLAMVCLGFRVYSNYSNSHLTESKKFLGDYKLLKLDKKVCDSCIVRLYDNYRYDIIVKGHLIDQGSWNIETTMDIPGYFLKLENGPKNVIWEHERLIEEIDRTRETAQ